MKDLSHRHRQEEWMDAPNVDPDLLRRSLKFIRRINSLLGYTRATLHHLNRFSQSWTPGQRITILDLATGSADIPLAILAWATRRNFDIRIVAVDRHPTTATIAAAAASTDHRLKIIQADVLALPFADASFDYTLTSLFLHHLDDSQIVTVLKTMNRLSRRGIIVADLLRNRRAYFWINLFTLFSNPIVRHDAAVSVAQAFTPSEIISLARQAGIDFLQYHPKFGHRFVLAGQKSSRARTRVR